MIYFDYNATTPLDPFVREAMVPFLTENWGNPSSIHQAGRRARAALDDAHERAALILGCKPSEIVFTSGGTESANFAIMGAIRKLREKGRHLVTSHIEHHAVLHCCDYLEKYEGFTVTRLPVDSTGCVAPEDLKKALRKDTVLVSIMAANNEIGTIQPIAELGSICRNNGVLFYTDAVQWFGKEPFTSINELSADLVSICAHKIHGPKGAGALYIRSPFQPHSLIMGGSHENERRAGTENLAGIMGLVETMERFLKTPVFPGNLICPLTERLISSATTCEGVQFVGSREQRLSNTASFVVEGTDSMALLAGLDLEGICASSGSACSAGSLEPSHVIRALGFDDKLANALVRFSLGRESTSAEVDEVIGVFKNLVARLRTIR